MSSTAKPDEKKMERLEKETSPRKRAKSIQEWRSIFALIILLAYFVIIAGIVMKAVVFSGDRYDMLELLNATGALIGTPLGFVIGYYYKSKN